MGTKRRQSKGKTNGGKGVDDDPNLGEIMNEQATLDRDDAVSEILNKGLEEDILPAFEELSVSLKLARKTTDLQEKRHQLERVTELSTTIREDCRRLRRETGPKMEALP